MSSSCSGTYRCVFRYKNTYHEATKDVTVHPLPLEPNIMVDPLEASGLCTDSHHFRCCLEEDEDYKVMFQMESFFFPAGETWTTNLVGRETVRGRI